MYSYCTRTRAAVIQIILIIINFLYEIEYTCNTFSYCITSSYCICAACVQYVFCSVSLLFSCRTQLWRLREPGLLIHGAGPSDADSGDALVLDVDDIALQPLAFSKRVPLAVRRVDPARRFSQHWCFTDDGHLRPRYVPNLCVQVLRPSITYFTDNDYRTLRVECSTISVAVVLARVLCLQ